MEHTQILKLIPNYCPEGCDDCMGCPYFGGIEDEMVRCFRDEDKPFNNERN